MPVEAELLGDPTERQQAQADEDACTRFRFEHQKLESMIVAGDTLLAGGDKEVLALNARTGQQLWTAPLPGVARGLTVANQRLLVSTAGGDIVCFASAPAPQAGAQAPAAPGFPRDATAAAFAAAAVSILKLSGV